MVGIKAPGYRLFAPVPVGMQASLLLDLKVKTDGAESQANLAGLFYSSVFHSPNQRTRFGQQIHGRCIKVNYHTLLLIRLRNNK